jgi:hypothetical protein
MAGNNDARREIARLHPNTIPRVDSACAGSSFASLRRAGSRDILERHRERH